MMRNAMISTVTLLSMRMAAMLGGSVIIETVFSVPGIGKLASDASSAGTMRWCSMWCCSLRCWCWSSI